MSTDPELEHLRQEARNPQTPPSRLWELSQSEDYLVRIGVLSNLSTSGELLAKIALTLDNWNKNLLLKHPSLLPETLHQLINEGYNLWEALYHPNLDISGLKLIIQKSDPHFLISILKHPLYFPELLDDDLLFSAQDLPQNYLYLLFPFLSSTQQEKLCYSGIWIFQEAYARLGQDVAALQQLAQHENRMVRRGVGLNPATPAEVLETLSRDLNKHVRAGVAANPALSEALLTRLAADSNGLVRGVVAARADAPAQVLATLAQDGLAWIRARAQQAKTLIVNG